MQTRRSLVRSAAVLLGAAFLPASAGAAETVTVGTVGQASANLWPVFIGINKGFFAAEDLKVDVVYVQSSAQLVQQITAGSLDICMSTGLVDPLRAIQMGASIAVVRVEVQAPPYALLAKANIKSLKELKGKVISLGGPKDITRIYVERMLEPNGVKPGEFDMVFAGATVARASSLLAGAVDAAILLPPFSFQTEAAGFNNLGLTIDYASDLPFSGIAVNARWANEHKALLQRILAAPIPGASPGSRMIAIATRRCGSSPLPASSSRRRSRRLTTSCAGGGSSSRPARSRNRSSLPWARQW